MNIKLIARYVGIALVFNAIFMFISVLISMFNGFDASFSPLVISGFITLLTGLFPVIFVRESEDITLKDGFAITIFAWVLSCLFGMLPFVLYGGEFSLINAWFESVSGYTTTGGTILNNVEGLPKGLVFWRSSTNFIGGIGVVVFMLLVLPTMSTFRVKMSKMEISSLSKDNYRFQTKGTLRVITTVYLSITIATTFFLVLAGMPLFDAVNHAFSIVATGGFSVKNASIQAYNSFPIEFVSMFFMLLSGLHFGLIYTSFATRSWKIFHSPIIRFYLLTVLLSGIAIAMNIKFNGVVDTWGMAFRQSFFHAVSISTSTGLAIADSNLWGAFPMIILLYLSIQCACSGSTTGGIKADRVWIFIKSIKANIRRQLHPNAIIPIKVGNNIIEAEVVNKVSLFISIYLAIVLMGALILAMLGVNFEEAVSSSISAMGNVGPAFGACGSMGNFSLFPAFGKFVLTLEMLLGRLEIFPLLMIFVLFNKKN